MIGNILRIMTWCYNNNILHEVWDSKSVFDCEEKDFYIFIFWDAKSKSELCQYFDIQSRYWEMSSIHVEIGSICLYTLIKCLFFWQWRWWASVLNNNSESCLKGKSEISIKTTPGDQLPSAVLAITTRGQWVTTHRVLIAAESRAMSQSEHDVQPHHIA